MARIPGTKIRTACGHPNCQLKVGDIVVECAHAFAKDADISRTEAVRVMHLQILHHSGNFLAGGDCVQARGVALCTKCLFMHETLNTPLAVLISAWRVWEPDETYQDMEEFVHDRRREDSQ